MVHSTFVNLVLVYQYRKKKIILESINVYINFGKSTSRIDPLDHLQDNFPCLPALQQHP